VATLAALAALAALKSAENARFPFAKYPKKLCN
jgi:hypothetical protein